MNPKESRAKLSIFLASLPDIVFSALLDKKIELQILPLNIASEHGFVLYETGNICEGVRRVLSGEDSPSNFVAFIQKDERIEEDNRSKIPELAYEIQTKIFDQVLPILKVAGFPIKEGKVLQPAISPPAGGERLAVSERTRGQTSVQTASPVTVSSSPSSSELTANRYPPAGGLNADDRNIRALMRVAAETTYSEQNLQDAFEDLPPGLRQSLSSVDTANAIQAIAKKYLLHVDQMAALASETGLVLLGLTHPANFIGNLTKRLRLKEDDAKEIARDISAEIFTKVRDALRGLHEENPKSEIRNPKQSLNSNIQNTSQRTSPAVPLSPSELNAKRSTLNASSNTPYSAGAKWNTGENPSTRTSFGTGLSILAKQAAQREGPLSRNEVLRGIENPSKIQPTTNYRPPTTQEGRGAVGPTGWKPGQNEVGSMNDELRKKEEQPPKTTPFGKGEGDGELNDKRYTQNASAKIRPQSDGAFPPSAQKPEAEDFLDQKLEAPMATPKEKKRYTSDPYREPLDS